MHRNITHASTDYNISVFLQDKLFLVYWRWVHCVLQYKRASPLRGRKYAELCRYTVPVRTNRTALYADGMETVQQVRFKTELARDLSFCPFN